MIMIRYLEYSVLKEHLFMLDFCYFMNLSVVIQTTLFPSNLLWYKVSSVDNILQVIYFVPLRQTMFCVWVSSCRPL